MNTKKVLIICDSEYQYHWGGLANAIKGKVGAVDIILGNDISQWWNNHQYDVIVVDVSNIENLYSLIPEIHNELPSGRIVIVSSTPTWKQTREVIRLGAFNVIRKSSNLDEFINELQLL